MNKIPVWIDTDTGLDDAIALLTAFKLDKLDIVGISTVAGSTTQVNAFKNARNIVYLGGCPEIKVYPGAEKPLIKDLDSLIKNHNKNYLDGTIMQDSPAPTETTKVWDALYEKAKQLNGELVLITIGPLTNIAIAIAKHPDIVNYIKCMNIMGGCVDGGNITPCAEFNIYSDPQAAENVFKSGIHVNMFGLDVTLKALLSPEQANELVTIDNKACKLFKDCISSMHSLCQTDKPGLALHDLCPVMFVQYPEWFTGKDCGIYVETQGTISQGKTCSDVWTDYKYEDRHCTVYLDIDNDKFIQKMMDIYKNY